MALQWHVAVLEVLVGAAMTVYSGCVAREVQYLIASPAGFKNRFNLEK